MAEILARTNLEPISKKSGLINRMLFFFFFLLRKLLLRKLRAHFRLWEKQNPCRVVSLKRIPQPGAQSSKTGQCTCSCGGILQTGSDVRSAMWRAARVCAPGPLRSYPASSCCKGRQLLATTSKHSLSPLLCNVIFQNWSITLITGSANKNK